VIVYNFGQLNEKAEIAFTFWDALFHGLVHALIVAEMDWAKF
jgi:hypothetical protein